MESIFALLLILLAIILTIIVYFLPSIIASRRDMASSGAVFWVNLFLGCTDVIWLEGKYK
jgi:hypothetical protein